MTHYSSEHSKCEYCMESIKTKFTFVVIPFVFFFFSQNIPFENCYGIRCEKEKELWETIKKLEWFLIWLDNTSTAACGVSSTSALAISFPCFLASFFIFLSLALFSALVSFTIPSSILVSSAVPSSLRSFSDTVFEAAELLWEPKHLVKDLKKVTYWDSNAYLEH